MCLFVSVLALQDRLHDGKTGQVSGGGMTGVAGESKHGVKDALGLLDQKLRATGKSEFELAQEQRQLFETIRQELGEQQVPLALGRKRGGGWLAPQEGRTMTTRHEHSDSV